MPWRFSGEGTPAGASPRCGGGSLERTVEVADRTLILEIASWPPAAGWGPGGAPLLQAPMTTDLAFFGREAALDLTSRVAAEAPLAGRTVALSIRHGIPAAQPQWWRAKLGPIGTSALAWSRSASATSPISAWRRRAPRKPVSRRPRAHCRPPAWAGIR